MYILKRFLGPDFSRFNGIIDRYNIEQNQYINLTACVSYPFHEVLDVLGMPLGTVPTEGTRGTRFFPDFVSINEIEDYAEQLGLELFNIRADAYGLSIQPNSGTQANQIVFNAILSEDDTIMCLSPKDGGHISHSKLGCRNLHTEYIHLDNQLEIDYNILEKKLISKKPALVVVGASSYIKEFDYKRIYEITSNHNVPLMADICHSVLYIMGKEHHPIFPYVDFATFTMDKLLCGPQGGVVVYKKEYESKINNSIFPKTQGGPIQNAMFAKTMCFLKLSTMNIQKYARDVLKNTSFMIEILNQNGVVTINDSAKNHIILIDVSERGITGRDAENRLFDKGILVNRNQIPNDPLSPLITSGIRIGLVPLTNLGYRAEDISVLGLYIADVIKDKNPSRDKISELIKQYHNINISSLETSPNISSSPHFLS